MKFLVDAQLPRRLAKLLQKAGYDTLHIELGGDAIILVYLIVN